jgi:biotin synthase
VLHARHAHAGRADRLAERATAYANLDTSPEFYGKIITTRTYDERLETCPRATGRHHRLRGIIGLGEDRRVSTAS